uniref:Uncharacterized protein n=1 Tax=Knipowitschia caucasica TaxID=637954 RepID=A0AAV2KB10_KNICA
MWWWVGGVVIVWVFGGLGGVVEGWGGIGGVGIGGKGGNSIFGGGNGIMDDIGWVFWGWEKGRIGACSSVRSDSATGDMSQSEHVPV